ncbi:MAG: flagellar biosynthesis protein FlhB [Lachnospiraceae bacterium]|nr:flagellar biosynthesis protein FlhB [Lachnospiraceae bacterium]
MEAYFKLNLQFFAEGEGGEKTEDATSKKLEKAREEGQVAKSMELVTGVSLLLLFVALKAFVGTVGQGFMESFVKNYNYIGNYVGKTYDSNISFGIFREILLDVIKIGAPFYIVAVVSAIGVNVGQISWKVTTKPLMPKLERLDPIKGFQRMFSKDKLVELLKSILKVGIIFYVVYSTMKDSLDLLLTLYDYSLMDAVAIVGDVVISLGIKISALLLGLGVADLLYQKIKFKNEMKMTKQEVKDEYKQTEGDPQIKGKIRRKMQESSMRRMMQEIPEADVVITNPTHFAVAIKYDKSVSAAPLVTAKGADHLAQRIKEIAREYKVEIVENKPLARMLYYNVEIGNEIPPELYQMVADILAHVYQAQNRVV